MKQDKDYSQSDLLYTQYILNFISIFVILFSSVLLMVFMKALRRK